MLLPQYVLCSIAANKNANLRRQAVCANGATKSTGSAAATLAPYYANRFSTLAHNPQRTYMLCMLRGDGLDVDLQRRALFCIMRAHCARPHRLIPLSCTARDRRRA